MNDYVFIVLPFGIRSRLLYADCVGPGADGVKRDPPGDVTKLFLSVSYPLRPMTLL